MPRVLCVLRGSALLVVLPDRHYLFGYKCPEWGNIFIAQGNALGMYNYFTERPVRTKVKPVKLYAQDNAIHSQALQITNNR